jgi:mono/diheme cytochrome c family protein
MRGEWLETMPMNTTQAKPASAGSPLAAAMLLWLVCAGCQQQMADQPSYKPLDESTFFDDGRSARDLVNGTVPRGHLRTDLALYTGRRTRVVPTPTAQAASGAGLPGVSHDTGDVGTPRDVPGAGMFIGQNNEMVDTFPFPINRAIIEHGYHRFMIYCVVCHDPLGTGHGKIVERGYTRPPSYHVDRLRNAPVGHLYAVISEGFGSMPSYAGQISAHDRWAIVAYLRALQASQHFPRDRLTPEMRRQWDRQTAARNAP